jgi:hypothetical protein
MSKRRKQSNIEKMRARAARAYEQATTNPELYLDTLPETTRNNYLQVAELVQQAPEGAKTIGAFTPEMITNLLVGLAHPDIVGDDYDLRKHEVASQIRIWHVLNRLDTPFDRWPDNIVTMTDEQIVEKCLQDGRSGFIPRPPRAQ